MNQKFLINMPIVKKNKIFFTFETNLTNVPLNDKTIIFEFPQEIDLDILTVRDLATMTMLIFWPFFNLFKKTKIYLPFNINSGELEMWLRLSDCQRVSLNNDIRDLQLRPYELGGNSFNISRTEHWNKKNDGVVTCVSGGKDSLLQFALYNEFDISKPIGLIVVSPMPPNTDQITLHRASIVSKFQNLGLKLISVKSNLRTIYNNRYPLNIGFKWALNEIVDCQLYLAACFSVAKYYRMRGIAIASEFDVQKILKIDDKFIATEYFMYHIFCLASLNKILLYLHNITLENIVVSLSHYNIQELLVTKFPELFSLQDSCYEKKDNTRWCSDCVKCFMTAVCLLSLGIDPYCLGIDTMKVLRPKAYYWNLNKNFRFQGTWSNIKYAASVIDFKKVKQFINNKSFYDLILQRSQCRLKCLRKLAIKCTIEDKIYSALPKAALYDYLPENIKNKLISFFSAHFCTIDNNFPEELIKGIDWTINYITNPIKNSNNTELQ